MLKLLKWYMAWRERHVMKYIGFMRLTATPADDPGKPIKFNVPFYMSESGRRGYTIPDLGKMDAAKILPRSSVGQEIEFWKETGHFPEHFVPETDTLGPMLRRIVDIQMGLDKGDDDEA